MLLGPCLPCDSDPPLICSISASELMDPATALAVGEREVWDCGVEECSIKMSGCKEVLGWIDKLLSKLLKQEAIDVVPPAVSKSALTRESHFHWQFNWNPRCETWLICYMWELRKFQLYKCTLMCSTSGAVFCWNGSTGTMLECKHRPSMPVNPASMCLIFVL